MGEQTPKYSPTELLLKDLEEAKTEENTVLVDKIKMKAILQHYNDFNSPYSTPQMLLYGHLKDAKLDTLATNVIEGKYDYWYFIFLGYIFNGYILMGIFNGYRTKINKRKNIQNDPKKVWMHFFG